MPSPLRAVSCPSIGGNCGSGIERNQLPSICGGMVPSTTRSQMLHSMREGRLCPMKSGMFGKFVVMSGCSVSVAASSPVFIRARDHIGVNRFDLVRLQEVCEACHAFLRAGAFQHDVIERRVCFTRHVTQIFHAADCQLTVALGA